MFIKINKNDNSEIDQNLCSDDTLLNKSDYYDSEMDQCVYYDSRLKSCSCSNIHLKDKCLNFDMYMEQCMYEDINATYENLQYELKTKNEYRLTDTKHEVVLYEREYQEETMLINKIMFEVDILQTKIKSKYDEIKSLIKNYNIIADWKINRPDSYYEYINTKRNIQFKNFKPWLLNILDLYIKILEKYQTKALDVIYINRIQRHQKEQAYEKRELENCEMKNLFILKYKLKTEKGKYIIEKRIEDYQKFVDERKARRVNEINIEKNEWNEYIIFKHEVVVIIFDIIDIWYDYMSYLIFSDDDVEYEKFISDIKDIQDNFITTSMSVVNFPSFETD